MALATVLLGHSSVYADAPSQAITLSPASTEITVDPGATALKTLDVINSGSETFKVALSSAPYHVSGVAYDPQFTQIPGTVDASEWVHLSTTDATVSGYKVLTITYTVQVPKNTAPGGYYAVVFAETSTDDVKTGVVSHNRVGNILYITVNGSIKDGGSLKGDALPLVHFLGSIPIGTTISNSGGTHFITKAEYSVTSFNGNKVFTSSNERYVLPQTEREISAPWTPQSMIGIFTVHRSATINGKVTTLPDQKIYVVNPWVLIAFVFVIGVLIGLPISRVRRRRRSKEQ